MMERLVFEAALRNPNGTAIVSPDGNATWTEFAARVAGIAEALRSLGVGAGDHVAILSGNSPAHLAATYAVWLAEAVLVPLNTRLSRAELSALVTHAEIDALLFSDETEAAAASVAAEGRVPISAMLDEVAATSSASWAGPAVDPSRSSMVAGIIYTGGTTGTPKGAMLTDRSFEIQALILDEIMGHDQHSAYLHTSPLFHLSGLTHAHAITRAAGTHVFPASPAVEDVISAISVHGVNVLGLVPTSLSRLLDHPKGADAALSRIEHVGYGASPISEALLRRAVSALPNARFHQVYGQTEAGGSCLTLPPDAHVLSGPGSGRLSMAGIPLPSFEVRIFGPQDRDCDVDEVGEIVIRGEGVMRGYWRDPERTAEALRGGYLRTGDLGRRDQSGYVTIVGRSKDMIITGGENVYAAEVERVLGTHPDVTSCAVVGVPDPCWGEAVHAFVVRRPGSDMRPGELVSFCKERIAGYKCPKRIWLQDEQLPLTGVGKVMKALLRERAMTASAESMPVELDLVD